MQNFKLTIEYDGSAYCGWQRQADDPTLQGTIETALATMTGQPITLIGSGRTDAGVHAYGQVASFSCATRLTPEMFQKGLNSLLPRDIVITDCCAVAAKFHARFDVQSKVYHYRILNRPLPAAIGRLYAWHVPYPLDLDAMQRACRHLVGTHDFKAFQGAGSPRPHTTRQVFQADLIPEPGDGLTFVIEGNGFLKFMVRNIVGTLVQVGQGKMAADDVLNILLSRDRRRAGITAPAHGLFLMQVKY